MTGWSCNYMYLANFIDTEYKYVDDGFVGDKVTTACDLGARAEKLNGPA